MQGMNQRAAAIRRRIADRFHDTEQASIRRDVLQLALPATGEQLLAMMVGLVNTYLVGHLGAAPLAAVGLATQWVFLAQTLFASIATGSTALIARFVGAGDPDDASWVLHQSMLVGVLVGLLTTVLGVGLARPLLVLLGAEPDVALMGAAYLRVVASFFLFSTVTFLGNACLRGAGDTRTPMYVMAVVNVVNTIVAWVAINGPFGLPKLGVVGSALGAASGTAVGGILVVAILLRGRSGLHLRLSQLRFDSGLVRRILNIGLPTGLEQILFRSGHMVFARILAEMGTVVYAANQVAINGWSLSFMPGFGFAVAATTLVGQGLGAGEPELAERRGLATYSIGATIMTTIGLAFLFFPEQIMSAFTNDPEVIALGIRPLQMVGLFQPMSAAAMIFSGALRGAGDTRYPMVLTGVGIWLLRLPLSYLMGIVLGWGLLGAWAGMALDMTVRGVLCYRRFHAGRWKTIKV
jgi:multidrug resistance protein, MATE family